MRATFLIVCAVGLIGCGDDDAATGDAGTSTPDSGGRDAGAADGARVDAGDDAGVAADAGTGADASSGDSGSASDAAVDGGASCGSFTALGDLAGGANSSSAQAISRDGTTVVGQSESTGGPEAMRWTIATGMVGLGDLAGGTFLSLAYDVSSDGSTVAGISNSSLVDCPGRVEEAFRWTSAGGIVALGDLSGGCFASYAYGISSDGTLVLGGATNALSNTAATWSSATSMWTDLGFAASLGNSSNVNAATPDRATLVGTDRLDATAEYQAFSWTSAGGLELLGDLPGGIVYATANGVSDDATIIVGFGTSASGQEAFRWTSAGGMVALGDFASGSFESSADTVSPDGTLIVGYGRSAIGSEAAMWDSGMPMARVSDVLVAHGVTIPTGFQLTAANGVAVNGSVVTIAGQGLNGAGEFEAWVASYCVP